MLDAHLARIAALNPALNAIVTLDAQDARAQAAAIDAARARGAALGPWAGLPIAIKDMEATRGMRTTLGSPIFRDAIPEHDALFVERLRGHGLVIIGKTNTPEFAMGSQTFNPVFGATRNPWNPDMTCGGSSGGAAVCVATGMLPFADGSDIGGSLRNPGNFNHVLGLRPSPGRVPDAPSVEGWHGLSVLGPIARTASDAAFLLAAMAGPDARDPLSIAEDPAAFLRSLDRDLRGVRVAVSRTLGGLPVDPEVARVLQEGVALLQQQGCIVEEEEPDFAGADLAFDTQRALFFAARYAPLLAAHRHEMKDTAVWNIEQACGADPAADHRGEPRANAGLPRDARVSRTPRIPDRAGEPGAAVSGGTALRHRDQRRDHGQLHRVDAKLHPDLDHVAPRGVGPLRLHPRRAARGDPGRGPLPRRIRRAADGARDRAGESACRAEAGGARGS